MRNLPVTLLDSVSAAGTGPSVDLEGLANFFYGTLITTGSPASLSVKIEGSLDNQNWYAVSVTSTNVAAFSTFTVSGVPQLVMARYIRGNLVSISGGTVTLIAAATQGVY